MKKIFGKIDLTWKKVIIYSIIIGIYTAIMALLPITKDTSFRDIAIQFEWWILFGIIIICNSKSPMDSALKCFVFFLISQPLIYLLQVPFSSMGFGLFKYYRYWFIWTLLTLPMGFIGYYINKKNWLSVIILLPMLLLLALLGLGYFTAMVESFPHHLLSFISCFAIIIVVVLNVFDKPIYKIISLVAVFLASLVYIILNGGIMSSEYETYRSLDGFGITYDGDIVVSSFTGTAIGNAEITVSTEEIHTIKINGKRKGKYTFTIMDDSGIEYSFEYHYDDESKSVVLNRTN